MEDTKRTISFRVQENVAADFKAFCAKNSITINELCGAFVHYVLKAHDYECPDSTFSAKVEDVFDSVLMSRS